MYINVSNINNYQEMFVCLQSLSHLLLVACVPCLECTGLHSVRTSSQRTDRILKIYGNNLVMVVLNL